MSPADVLLAVHALQVLRGGVTVLDVPDLAISRGEVLSLIGPNGAGKTTLLQALAYLLRPKQGELRFNGRHVGPEYPVLDFRRSISMVFQEPLLFDATVTKNVASGLRLRGLRGPEAKRTVAEELERFGIAHLRDRSARKLSGGEAQRTSLARAFATKPEIVFLDEPFSALDQPSRESLIDDLQAILRATGTTAVLATHDRTEALRLSDRIAVMRDGRIVQLASAEDVMNRPGDEFVASFVGVETVLRGTVRQVSDGHLLADVAGVSIEAVADVAPGETVVLCIRPENVTLSADTPGPGSSARNQLSGRVVKVATMGLYQRVTLDCGFPLVAYVTASAIRDLCVREGETVTASFKATAVHVLRQGSR